MSFVRLIKWMIFLYCYQKNQNPQHAANFNPKKFLTYNSLFKTQSNTATGTGERAKGFF